jgi:hypothetical protein
MFYKLLGMAVWKGAKWYLGRRVPVSTGSGAGTKALIVGGTLALGVGAAVVLGKRAGD